MKKSKEIALGGLMAAVSVVIMCFGGMIPIMTYVSPVICILIGGCILKYLTKSGFMAWYIAVAFLALILCPDKESAFIYGGLGYYPALRKYIEKIPVRWLIKIVYFNITILALYWVLIHFVGLNEILKEFTEMGTIFTLVTLILGNIVFIIVDRLLFKVEYIHKNKRKTR